MNLLISKELKSQYCYQFGPKGLFLGNANINISTYI